MIYRANKQESQNDKNIRAASTEAFYDLVMKSIYGNSYDSLQDKYIRQIMGTLEEEIPIEKEEKISENTIIGN